MVLKGFKRLAKRDPTEQELEAMNGMLEGLADGRYKVEDLMKEAEKTKRLINEENDKIEG